SSPASAPSSPCMRAMPSPVESTVPVSRTSIRLSKSLISCFSISLISDARICITDLSPRCFLDRPSFLARTRSSQTLALPSQAAVERPALEVHDRAAEELWEDARVGDDAFAGLMLENLVDAGSALVGKRLSREHAGTHTPERIVFQTLVLRADRRQILQPV